MKVRSREPSRFTTSEIRRSCSSAIISRLTAFFPLGLWTNEGRKYCRDLNRRNCRNMFSEQGQPPGRQLLDGRFLYSFDQEPEAQNNFKDNDWDSGSSAP